ncbi:hypothetical protein ACOME3_007863 [Neoechinorhynchus agilis]
MGSQKSKFDPTVLNEDALELLTANTNMSKQEILKWHAGFINDCPTGKLDKKQFVRIARQLMPEKPGDAVAKMCEFTFSAFDQDRNGYIDFYEFLLSIAATGASNSVDLQTRLSSVFDIYDIDKNGQVDQKELATILVVVGNLSGLGKGFDAKKKAKEIIEKADASGDGKLNRREFVLLLCNDEDIRNLLVQ